MLDEETPTSAPLDTPDQPPRRRRAASRPAGPPRAVEPAADVTLASAPDGEVAAASGVAQASEVGPASEVVPASVVAPASDVAPAGEGAPGVEAAEASEVPHAEAAPKATRARSRRKPVVNAGSVAQDALVEPGSSPAADAAAPSADEAVAAKPARRRRATRSATSEPDDQVVASADADVAASLDELQQRTPARRARVRRETFGISDEENPDAILDSLAAAIAAGTPAATAPDSEAEEPAAAEELAEEESVDLELAPEDSEADDIDEAEAEDSEADEADEEGVSSEIRRRRRRRGGRRRRRSTGVDDRVEAEDVTEDAAATQSGEAVEEEGEAAESVEEVASEGASRRRRRRRRRGEEIGEAEDDPTEVVVRVREPRRTRTASDEVTGIEGSTRMEAKKQRRREGRAAGRRRTPILSESEFLARRESVDRVMLIRQAEEYSQIAVLEDGILVEHYVDRASATSMIGNIYLGRVQNVLPSMEAAFIDIGRGRNAVLYAGEIDWDGYGVTGQDKKVERVFKSGQSVLVQVSKDPVGAKGARLTAHISLPGRYVVYSPGGQLSGISRKLPENERKRLKGILDELVGPAASVIVRTAAEGATEDELVRDVNRLKAQWEVIEKKVKAGQAPQQLYTEPELTVRIVRDLFTEDFARLVVDGNGKANDAYDSVEGYVTHVAPHLAERLEHWDRAGRGDLFDNHRVHEQVAKALERKVFLPSGGSLVIDRTEAMTVVDVNTGRFTGSSGNLEATVTSNNLEAAEEIVRQLRLRDIGGIIVIDFIDMVLPSNRELLLRRLVECLGRDRTRHQVAEVTSLGLVQMTRKKIGTGLAEAFTVPCETCKGSGYHIHDAPVASQAPADGGDRDNTRRSPRPSAAPPQASRRTARSRQPSPAPELAAVVAATFAHPVAAVLEHPVSEAEPLATEPVATEPVAAEPVAPEPVAAEPAEPELVEAVEPESVEAEAVETGPVAAAPAEAESTPHVWPEPDVAVPPQVEAEESLTLEPSSAMTEPVDVADEPSEPAETAAQGDEPAEG